MSSSTVDPPASVPAAGLFRDRNFVLLWLAQTVSSLGDWALMLAIPVTIYDATNSRAALSFSFVAETVPPLVLGLLAGVFVDRWNRRNVMIVSDLGRAAAVLLLLSVHNFKHLGRHDLWTIYTAAFLAAALSTFFLPARAALLAALLPRERLLQANALSSSSARLTQLAGPALGGVLLGWLHPRGVFVFDVATFLVSAACVALVSEPGLIRKAPRGLAGFRSDLWEGLRLFAPGTTLGTLMTLMGFAAFAGGIYAALEYAFVRDFLHVGGPAFGFMLSATGVGAVLAVPLLAGPFKAVAPPRLIAGGLAVMAVGGFGLAFSRSASVGAGAMFLMGLGNILMYLPVLTMFQTAAPPELRGRVFGTSTTVAAAIAALSSFIAVGLGTLMPDLRPLFAGLALMFLVCALLARPLLSRPADSPRA